MAWPDAEFRYQPLETTRQQIRLLSVLPESSGTIKCQLETANLDGDVTPEYRAVSYVWGPPTPMMSILVNDRVLNVRQNLYAFLEAFRARLVRFKSNGEYEDEIQWLWVDQICINQTVVDERNHQVKMMANIYQKAIYVYVWLGQSNSNIEAAMREIKCGLRNYYEGRVNQGSGCSKRNREKPDGINKAHRKSIPTSKKWPISHVHALKCFFENIYWQRLWIVQEIMLARYIRIICGETLLSWEELKRFCLSLLQSQPRVREFLPFQMIWMVKHALSAKTYTYTDLVMAFSMSKCHDPRDKVYGLQGLLAQSHRVSIDYAQSVDMCFLNAVHILRKDLDGAGTVQTANRFGHIDFTQPPEKVFFEATSILNAEADSIIKKSFLTALVNLGTEMGLDTRKLHAAWICRANLKQLQLQWNEIVRYYVEERLPILYSGSTQDEAFDDVSSTKRHSDDTLFLLQSTGFLDEITKALSSSYSALLFLTRRFLNDIPKHQGHWGNVDRLASLHVWEAFHERGLIFQRENYYAVYPPEYSVYRSEPRRSRVQREKFERDFFEDPFEMGFDDAFLRRPKGSSRR